MPKTRITGVEILDGSIQRVDLDTTTTGLAVITKAVSSSDIVLSSTGVDAGTGDVTFTLNPTAVSPGSYGGETSVATFTVDEKGRLTAAGATAIAITFSQVTNLSTWPGSGDLVTLGTVTTGVWNGSTISYAYGGTGISAPGITPGNMRWNGTAYTIDTTTYVSSASPSVSGFTTAGVVQTSDSGALSVLGSPGVDGYVLSSTTTGTLSWVAPGTGPGGGMSNPMTAVGDMIVGGTSDTPLALSAVAVNYVLASAGVGVAPVWSTTPTVSALSTQPASSAATIGAELLSLTGWTLNTGWTGAFDTGFTHSAGTGTLTNSTALVSGAVYQLSYTVSSYTSGSVSITYGGISAIYILSGISYVAFYGTSVVDQQVTNSTAGIVVTPSTDFVGTFTLSLKRVTAYAAAISLLNAAGSVATEIRGASVTSNTCVGTGTGQYLTSGANNTLLGYNAGGSLTKGSDNVNIGTNAGRRNSEGIQNIFIGSSSGAYNSSGTNNIFIGYQSGNVNTSGSYSLYLGYYAGLQNNGSANIFIGPAAGFNQVTVSNYLIIDPYTGRSDAATELTKSMIVGVGASTAAAATIKFNAVASFSVGFNIGTGIMFNTAGSAPGIITSSTNLVKANGSTTAVLDAGIVTTGVFGTARLGTGTPDNTVFLRGDGAWATTNMSFSLPSSVFTVTTVAGAPVASLALQSPSLVFAGPVSGDPAAPDFRALQASDIASVNASSITGMIGTAVLGTGSASSTSFLRGDSTWATIMSSSGVGGTGTFSAFSFSLDFGNQNNVASTVVVDSSATSTTKIFFTHTSEEMAIQGVQCYVSSLTPGVGYTITGVTPFGASGSHVVQALIIN